MLPSVLSEEDRYGVPSHIPLVGKVFATTARFREHKIFTFIRLLKSSNDEYMLQLSDHVLVDKSL